MDGCPLLLIGFSTRFLRLTLCTCLLLYGSDRTYLSKIGLVTDDDVKMLASR